MEIFSTELIKYLVKPIRELRDYWRNYGRQIPHSLKPYNTYFVHNDRMLEEVYKIRDSIFGKREFSGNAYAELIKKNRFGLKLLGKTDSRKGIAYHTIFPISKETYEKFKANQLSHKEIILQSIPWEEVGDKLYLYIAGVVVRKGVWNPSRMGYFILTDMICFLEGIFKHFPQERIGGICGYPSTKEGLKLFENKTDAFEYIGLDVDDNPIQKIFVSEGFDLEVLKEFCETTMRRDFAKRYLDDVRQRGKKRFVRSVSQAGKPAESKE